MVEGNRVPSNQGATSYLTAFALLSAEIYAARLPDIIMPTVGTALRNLPAGVVVCIGFLRPKFYPSRV